MSMHVISPMQWQTQSWANGGGITHELLRDEQEPWRFRISIAEVASAGPFSQFIGIDRQIFMLQGNGFRLHESNGDTVTIDRPLTPYAFAGEQALDCSLIDGPVRDFNVMSRRSDCHAQLTLHSLGDIETGRRLRGRCAALLQFFYVFAGRIALTVQGQQYVLDAEHSLALRAEPADFDMQAVSDAAIVASIAVNAC